MAHRAVSAAALSVIVLTACGGSFVERADKTISTTMAATNAAKEQFLLWDKEHQGDLVAKAQTREEGEAALSAYRVKRQRVVQAFTAVYVALSSAATLLPLVEHGTKSKRELDVLLVEVLKAALTVRTAIQELQEGF